MPSTVWNNNGENFAQVTGWIYTDPEDIFAFGKDCFGFMLKFPNDTLAPTDEESNLGYVLCITDDDNTINDIKQNYQKGDLVTVGTRVALQNIGAGYITYSNNHFIQDNPSKNLIGFNHIESTHQAHLKTSRSEIKIEGMFIKPPTLCLDPDGNEFLVFSFKFPPYQHSTLCDPNIENTINCTVLHDDFFGNLLVDNVKQENYQAGEEVTITGNFLFSDYEFGQEQKQLGISINLISR